MMANRGTYIISNGKLRKDNSFKTCICLLLIVFTICVLLILAFTVFNKFKQPKDALDTNNESLNYQHKETTNSDYEHFNYRTIVDLKEKPYNRNNKITTISDRYIILQTNKTNNISDVEDYENENVDDKKFMKIIKETTVELDEHTKTKRSSISLDGPLLLTTNSMDLTTTNGNSTATNDNFKRSTKSIYSEKILNTTPTTVPSSYSKTLVVDDGGKTTALFDLITPFRLRRDHHRNDTSSTDDIINKNSTDKCLPPTANTCDTIKCKQSASKMISLIDHNADPCEDFYLYACGGMNINMIKDINSNDIIMDAIDFDEINTKNDDTTTNVYGKKFNDFYNSCLDYTNGPLGIIEISRFLKQLYDLSSSGDKITDLTELLGSIILLHPHRSSSRLLPIFDVDVEVDSYGKFMASLTLPRYKSILDEADNGDTYEVKCLYDTKKYAKSVNNAKTIYEYYVNCLHNQTTYVKYLEKSIIELQIFDHLSTFEKTQEISKTLTFIEWNILNVLHTLNQFEQNEYIRTIDINKTLHRNKYEIITYDELIKKYPEINWKRFFNIITNGKTINRIKILYPLKLDEIFKFYRTNSMAEIKNAILAMIGHDLYIDFINPRATCNRQKYCKQITINLMSDIAAKYYLKKFDKNDLKNYIAVSTEIFQKLSEKLTESFENATWLKTNELKKMKLKLNKIKFFVDITDGFSNEEWFIKKYELINVIENNFIENVFALKKVKRQEMYRRINENADKPEYIWNYLITPMATQPLRIHSVNLIVFPIGILSKYIHRKRNSLQNYEKLSKLGYLIAHEIFHFFDTVHIKNIIENDNDAFKSFEYNLKNPEFIKNENLFNILINTKDIELSIDNRFSDDAALQLSYETYEKYYLKNKLSTANNSSSSSSSSSSNDLSLIWLNFTIPQLFYLSIAQEYCSQHMVINNVNSKIDLSIELFESFSLPNYFRINLLAMNSYHFADSFKCRDGSAMHSSLIKMDHFPNIIENKMEYYRNE